MVRGATWAVLNLLAVGLLIPLPAAALEQKGAAEIDYGMRLDGKERKQALEMAFRNAVETWIANKQRSHYRNYERVKEEIDASIDDYVLSHQIVSETKEKRAYRLVVRAELNEPKLMSVLLEPSAADGLAEQQYLTFVFVAREKVGVESLSEKEASQSKSQSREIAKQRDDDVAAQSKSQTQTISSRKIERVMSDRALWDVTTANEIDVAMGDVFTEAQYLVIDAAFLEEETGHLLSVESFVEDYRHGDDVKPSTKREALKGLVALKDGGDPVHYLAIGTLDVGVTQIDEKTGNHKVAVSVTGQILSVFRRGAAVAKVGPEVMFGEGPSDLVAKNNALKSSAQQVASQLVAKLSARNIR